MLRFIRNLISLNLNRCWKLTSTDRIPRCDFERVVCIWCEICTRYVVLSRDPWSKLNKISDLLTLVIINCVIYDFWATIWCTITPSEINLSCWSWAGTVNKNYRCVWDKIISTNIAINNMLWLQTILSR